MPSHSPNSTAVKKERLKTTQWIISSIMAALLCTARLATAAPISGSYTGLLTVTLTPTGESLSVSTSRTIILTTGETVCQGAMLSNAIVDPPTGACAEGEFESIVQTRHVCTIEGLDGVMMVESERGVSCVAARCAEENGLFDPACVVSWTTELVVRAGTGDLAGATGRWTEHGEGHHTYFVPDPYLLTTSFQGQIDGEFALADDTVLPAGVVLENPAPGGYVSGGGMVSGWSCLGGDLVVKLYDEHDTLLLTQTVLQGSERPDTEAVCGDIHNGFSSLINWGRLGRGRRTAVLVRNEEVVAEHRFFVSAFDVEFVEDQEGECTIADFPTEGDTATFTWQESQQALVLTSSRAAGEGGAR